MIIEKEAADKAFDEYIQKYMAPKNQERVIDTFKAGWEACEKHFKNKPSAYDVPLRNFSAFIGQVKELLKQTFPNCTEEDLEEICSSYKWINYFNLSYSARQSVALHLGK